jgi:hypothetical protein
MTFTKDVLLTEFLMTFTKGGLSPDNYHIPTIFLSPAVAHSVFVIVLTNHKFPVSSGYTVEELLPNQPPHPSLLSDHLHN